MARLLDGRDRVGGRLVSVRLVVHWTLVLAATAVVSVAAPLPFNSPAAGWVGALAVIAVACIGYATAPTPRKDSR